MKPVVAIVGRANVGKSTLFNRIVGGRRAITGDLVGITRDRHYGLGSWNGREFLVIDTAGLVLEVRGGLEEKVQGQVRFALEEADTILFLVDGRAGLVPEEKTIDRLLRRSGKRVVVAVNKIDQPSDDTCLAEFYGLGGEPVAVSAEHGTGVGDLLDKIVAPYPSSQPEVPEDDLIRVAIVGRPNVGKSSLLNRLLGEERAVVHEEAGTTRDVIDTRLSIRGQELLLLDTAGIRRRGKWSSTVERASVMAALKAMERADICLIVLDAAQGLQKQDAHIAGYAFEAQKGVVFLWNKWDLRRQPISETRKEIDQKLKFLSYAPVLEVSAKSGAGCEKIWPTVLELHRTAGIRVKTSRLNQVLSELVASHPPPSYRGRPLRFPYAAPVGSHPPRFVLFTNVPEAVPESYRRYLIHGLRRFLRLGGVPVVVSFRKKN